MLKLLILILVMQSTAYAGINFAMMSTPEVPEVPIFKSLEQAQNFASSYAGNKAVLDELKLRINRTSDEIRRLLHAWNGLENMVIAAKLADENYYDRRALIIIESNVGSTIYAGSVPINGGKEWHTNCKSSKINKI